MKTRSSLFVAILSIVLLASCGIFGIHFNVHNPKKPGKPVKYDQETILLGALTELRSCFDVHFYDLDIAFDPKEKSLKGTVEIHAIAVKNFDKFQIDLDDQFMIHSIELTGTREALTFEREERAVYVSLSKNAGEQFSISVVYEGKPEVAKKAPWMGGFVWDKDKNGKPWLGVACETDGASVWWPLKDHTSDEPDSVKLHYTVPKEIMGVGNGTFMGMDEGEFTNTYHWQVTYPINTYNITFYGGDFKLLSDEYVGIEGDTLPITHYVLRDNYEKAKKQFKVCHRILKNFEELFGTYPWYRDGFRLVESPYAGMEHQSAIAYGSGYKEQRGDQVDYIILHETAHEWWGNSVTVNDLADVWIQEGFATYAEALYYEKVNGYSAYENHLAFYKLVIRNKYPVVSEHDRRCFHAKRNADVYMKGAWILHTLRRHMGNDELFMQIIKGFGIENKRKMVDSQDFVDYVNLKTGKDYSWFFDQYLHQNEAPELLVNYDGDQFYYKWHNTKENFNQLGIKVKTLEGSKLITPTSEWQSIKLPTGSDGKGYISFYDDKLYARKKVSKRN